MSPSNLTSSDFRDYVRSATAPSLLFYPPQADTAPHHRRTCHIAIQPDPADAVNLREPQFLKSTAITTAELLLINV